MEGNEEHDYPESFLYRIRYGGSGRARNYVQRDSSQEIPQGQPVAVDHALLYFMGSGRGDFKSTAQLRRRRDQ